jgi:hypothetical protein
MVLDPRVTAQAPIHPRFAQQAMPGRCSNISMQSSRNGSRNSDGKKLLLERELASPFLRLPVEAGHVPGIEVETGAQGGGRFPFSALMGEH